MREKDSRAYENGAQDYHRHEDTHDEALSAVHGMWAGGSLVLEISEGFGEKAQDLSNMVIEMASTRERRRSQGKRSSV